MMLLAILNPPQLDCYLKIASLAAGLLLCELFLNSQFSEESELEKTAAISSLTAPLLLQQNSPHVDCLPQPRVLPNCERVGADHIFSQRNKMQVWLHTSGVQSPRRPQGIRRSDTPVGLSGYSHAGYVRSQASQQQPFLPLANTQLVLAVLAVLPNLSGLAWSFSPVALAVTVTVRPPGEG